MDCTLEIIITSVILVGSFGIAVNIITLIALRQSKIISPLTALSFKSQCVIDLFTCCLIVVYKLVPNDVHTGWTVFDKILCHVWSRDNLFWLGYIASVHNLVCISFDRMVAVMWPIQYRSKQPQLITGCIVYLTVVTVVVFVPNCFLRRYRDGRCYFEYAFNSPQMLDFFELEGYSWLFSTYLFPALSMVGTYVMIIRIIQRREKNIRHLVGYFKPSVKSNVLSKKMTFRRQIRNLLVTTVAMAATSLLLRLWETIIYMVTHAGLFPYANGSARQQIGVLLSTLGSVTNPCILISTNRPLRVSIARCIRYVRHSTNCTKSESVLTTCRTWSVPLTNGNVA